MRGISPPGIRAAMAHASLESPSPSPRSAHNGKTFALLRPRALLAALLKKISPSAQPKTPVAHTLRLEPTRTQLESKLAKLQDSLQEIGQALTQVEDLCHRLKQSQQSYVGQPKLQNMRNIQNLQNQGQKLEAAKHQLMAQIVALESRLLNLSAIEFRQILKDGYNIVTNHLPALSAQAPATETTRL